MGKNFRPWGGKGGISRHQERVKRGLKKTDSKFQPTSSEGGNNENIKKLHEE